MAKRNNPNEKPLVWEHGEIKSPPFTKNSRIEAGYLLGRIQGGESLGPPHVEKMPAIGPRCYELKVEDGGHWWRIFYRIDSDAIVIVEVTNKKTNATPKQVIDKCQNRLAEYDRKVQVAKKAYEANKRKGGK